MKRKKPQQSPLMPERIDRYDVLLPIASGGMGTVYLARSRGLGGFEREIALKVMHSHLREEESFAHDLIEEAKLAGRIKHPNVVQVLDVGEDPHGVFLVMEYVEGDSLAGLRRTLKREEQPREHMPVRIGLRIVVDALQGLHAAHELRDDDGQPLGLVHRDFSPQNILVGIDGSSRLTDFGVAKAKNRLTHTATGLIKGKIHYMSPEQAKTEPVDRRTDVWAAGVIVWELLAERALYREHTDTGILLQLITEPPPRLRRVKKDVSRTLEDAVAFALATSVDERFATAAAFARALEEGAREMGGLADCAEVAAYVRELAGAHLAKRRAQVAEVRKLRAEMKNIALEATTDADMTTPSTAGLSNLDDAARAVVIAEDDDTLEMTSPDRERPTRKPSDVRPDRAADEPSVTEVSQSLTVEPDVLRRAGRARLSWVAAGMAVATVGATWALSRQSEPAPAQLAEREGSAPAGTGALAAAAPTEVAGASARAAGTADTGNGPPSVEVRANAPLSNLSVGDRSIEIKRGSTELAIDLQPTERGAPLKIVARSTDGRTAEARLRGGESAIALVFPAAATRPGREPASKPAPLAPSPYDP